MDFRLAIMTITAFTIFCAFKPCIVAFAVFFTTVRFLAFTSLISMVQTILSKVSGILNFILVFTYITAVETGTFFSTKLPLCETLAVQFEAACLFANTAILLLLGWGLKIFLGDNRNGFWRLRRVIMLEEVEGDVVVMGKDKMIIKIHIFDGLQRAD